MAEARRYSGRPLRKLFNLMPRVPIMNASCLKEQLTFI